jgi:universal stress protein A
MNALHEDQSEALAFREAKAQGAASVAPASKGAQQPLISRILVPIDFSNRCAAALDHAVALARQVNANLTLLHVIDINAQASSEQPGDAESLQQRLCEEGFAQMGRLAWSLASQQIETQTLIVEGLPWEQIVEKSQGYDLLVMPKPGAKPYWHIFSRHTVRRVIEMAQCPVLVVRGPS